MFLRKRAVFVRAIVSVGLVAFAAVSAAAGRSGTATYGNWAPSFAQLSGANRLPVVTSLPQHLNNVVRHAASATGGDPIAALQSLRLVGS
jgi:hypothetical protein